MELGQKIKQARQEAGLSQRQLCGNAITRNMLSQIENGSARPSMATLQYLAGRLGKSVSFFLEEQAVLSPNPDTMHKARGAYAAHQYSEVLAILSDYQAPDPLFDEEWSYLSALSALALAEEQAARGEMAAAAPLLEQVHRGSIYYRQDMEQKRRHLLRQCYQVLEQQCREREDYKHAYFYACKLREFS